MHDAKELETGLNTPMLRFVTENIESLFEGLKTKDVFHESTTKSNCLAN